MLTYFGPSLNYHSVLLINVCSILIQMLAPNLDLCFLVSCQVSRFLFNWWYFGIRHHCRKVCGSFLPIENNVEIMVKLFFWLVRLCFTDGWSCHVTLECILPHFKMAQSPYLIWNMQKVNCITCILEIQKHAFLMQWNVHVWVSSPQNGVLGI